MKNRNDIMVWWIVLTILVATITAVLTNSYVRQKERNASVETLMSEEGSVDE